MGNPAAPVQIAPVAPPDDQLAYSPDGAAKKTGNGRTVIFEEIRSGRLKARKLGRRTVILHSDLTDWLKSLPLRSTSDRPEQGAA
jgi:hypothetical protein